MSLELHCSFKVQQYSFSETKYKSRIMSKIPSMNENIPFTSLRKEKKKEEKEGRLNRWK